MSATGVSQISWSSDDALYIFAFGADFFALRRYIAESFYLFLSQRNTEERFCPLESVGSLFLLHYWVPALDPKSTGRWLEVSSFLFLFSVSLWVTSKQPCRVTAQPRAFTSTILLSQAHFLPSLFKAAHIHVQVKRIIVKALVLP